MGSEYTMLWRVPQVAHALRNGRATCYPSVCLCCQHSVLVMCVCCYAGMLRHQTALLDCTHRPPAAQQHYLNQFLETVKAQGVTGVSTVHTAADILYTHVTQSALQLQSLMLTHGNTHASKQTLVCFGADQAVTTYCITI